MKISILFTLMAASCGLVLTDRWLHNDVVVVIGAGIAALALVMMMHAAERRER